MNRKNPKLKKSEEENSEKYNIGKERILNKDKSEQEKSKKGQDWKLKL